MAVTAGTTATSAIIDVHGIGKSYRQAGKLAGRGQLAALRNVDLRMETGAVLGLLGPNGAGKTTLIKILAGLLRPDSGGGSVLDYDLLRQHRQIRAHVGLVAPTADVGIDNNLTVWQNLDFWASVYGLHGAQARARIAGLLERLGLADKADFWPMRISAGQRQRLALARSLLAETPLLFLDEPTNKLDQEGVRSVRQMIAELNREQGVTILLTTHVMEEAEELCGEIALLNAGELVRRQPTGELMRSLQLARPITLVIGYADRLPPHWQTEVSALPGVISVMLDGGGATPEGDGLAGDACHLVSDATLRVGSVDLRASTSTLLGWIRKHGLALRSMRAEPVTLTDVFTTLAQRRVQPAVDAE